MHTFGRLWLALVLVAQIGLTPVGAPAQVRPGGYLIGLQLYTVRDDCAKDFPGTLAAVAKMGYMGVELAGTYGRTADELREMLAKNHLTCYGAHVSLDDLMGNKFDETVAYHQKLGNHYLVVASVPEERRNSLQAISDTAKLFSDIARRLKKRGILFAYHDHGGDFNKVDGEYSWLTFFKDAAADVKIEFDTGNALSVGVQAAPLISQFPGRVLSVHLKDFSATNPNALLGEGDEDWKSVIPLLKGAAGTRWFIIEQETYPFPPLECAEKCLRNFETMLTKY